MRGTISRGEALVTVPSTFVTVTGPVTVFGTLNDSAVADAPTHGSHTVMPLTAAETGPCAVKFAPASVATSPTLYVARSKSEMLGIGVKEAAESTEPSGVTTSTGPKTALVGTVKTICVV